MNIEKCGNLSAAPMDVRKHPHPASTDFLKTMLGITVLGLPHRSAASRTAIDTDKIFNGLRRTDRPSLRTDIAQSERRCQSASFNASPGAEVVNASRDFFSTQIMDPRDQLEAWREWYSPVFELAPKDTMGDRFPAKIRMWKFDGLAMRWTTAPAAHV